MPDAISDFFNNLLNGQTNGIPNIYILIIIGFAIFFIYLVVTRKPKRKEFVPMDMKKETKRRFKREYKYFGIPLHKKIYHANGNDKPLGYAIGYMKVVEMKQMKRFEPILAKIPKADLTNAHEKSAREIYNTSYSKLNDIQKRNVDAVSKEELREAKTISIAKNSKVKIRRGKKEVDYSIPVPLYCFKICSNEIMPKMLARFLNYGIDWAIFEKDQITLEKDRLLINADFQRRTPFDIFVFSKAGKNLVEDISYGQERENIWQETANQIPRAVHFDTEASKSLIYRREDAKIEKDKRRSQTESREIG